MRRPGQVRIIGGRWRGTRLLVPDIVGLRPSSDRIRETLFNWLQPVLPNARVLDLFAGTGALGLEALSRGASEATLLECDPAAAQALRETIGRLQAGDRARLLQVDALSWLRGQAGRPSDSGPYDIAFLDPPFGSGLLEAALPLLPPVLADGAWLYLESERDARPSLPDDWTLHREGQTREVQYALYRRHG
ncbi:MAG TPA: 16S rRNA (guanine(966)-N(2))-methyltransferase RsmD [Xanthomonadaceae bacterium]|nr:16S rRNA (guanine(966)-N(2))-methyltransferase RsmD [Xanthomonadaceae bacterium]